MAIRFQFRLEQVLNLRRQVEESKARELAVAQGQLLEIERSIRAHVEKETEFLAAYGQFEEAGIFSSDQAMAYSEYRDWLSRREKEYRQREQDWAVEVEKRRQTVVKASRERQLLENLKEKKRRQHSQALLGEEQRFLDETASIAFVRRERAQKSVGSAATENLGR